MSNGELRMTNVEWRILKGRCFTSFSMTTGHGREACHGGGEACFFWLDLVVWGVNLGERGSVLVDIHCETER
jgi:hypothetical protein